MDSLFTKILSRTFYKWINYYRLHNFDKTNSNIKLVIGAGRTFYKGWLSSDIGLLDISNRENWETYFLPNSISRILAEHVWEHLDEDTCNASLKNCFYFLKPGGRLRIAVPDGFNNDPIYYNHVKPGGTGDGADDHKFLYNYKTLSEKLAKQGFKVELLEYFDESGNFNNIKWSSDDGPIKRSLINDHRNKNGQIKYTSLLLDGIKI